ncbi:hypothetical protein Areg01_11280 [Actinoplanes regularis]|nr:hypothetical protein Areg01_11280 [Actinoplanes regularis]
MDFRTPELSARVTITESLIATDRYAVKVTVQVLGGVYEFGPALLRLHPATGPDIAPITGRANPPVAFTLHTGVTRSWQVPFAHAVTSGAQILLTDPSGTVLAAWTTR